MQKTFVNLQFQTFCPYLLKRKSMHAEDFRFLALLGDVFQQR